MAVPSIEKGEIYFLLNFNQIRSNCASPSSSSEEAWYAALIAPSNTPTTKSWVTPCRYNAFNMPTCGAPRLPPSGRTNEVFALPCEFMRMVFDRSTKQCQTTRVTPNISISGVVMDGFLIFR